jgi:DNA polymerase III subunit epsilon
MTFEVNGVTYFPIYYDFETTGLFPNSKFGKSDRAVELSALDPTTGKVFDTLIDPDRKIPKKSFDVHGITDDMVKDSPYFADVAEDFRNFCLGDGTRSHENVILIAHNNRFDQSFLEMEFARAEVELPQWNYIDSLKIARTYRPDIKQAHGLDYKLQTLRDFFGIAENRAHRALDDVYILHEVFDKLREGHPIDELLTTCNPNFVAPEPVCSMDLSPVGDSNPINPFG